MICSLSIRSPVLSLFSQECVIRFIKSDKHHFLLAGRGQSKVLSTLNLDKKTSLTLIGHRDMFSSSLSSKRKKILFKILRDRASDMTNFRFFRVIFYSPFDDQLGWADPYEYFFDLYEYGEEEVSLTYQALNKC